jgi:hypothetical protein
MRKTEFKGFSPTVAILSYSVRLFLLPPVHSYPASVRLIFPPVVAMMPAPILAAPAAGAGRGSARRLEGHFAMKNWVLAAVLAVAALAMYVGIFVKVGG